MAPVAHVLLCTDNTLRLYPADGLKQGDRCALWRLVLQPSEPDIDLLAACTSRVQASGLLAGEVCLAVVQAT